MPHFFERRDVFGNSPAIWVLSGLLFVVPISWWSLEQVRLADHVETWLPANDSAVQTQRWADQVFADDERILVSWSGSSLGDPRIDAFLEQLEPQTDSQGVPRGGSPLVANVADPRRLLKVLQQNGVEPHEAVRRLEGILIGAGPLRVRLTEAGRKSQLARHPEDLAAAASKALGIAISVVPLDDALATTAMVPGVDTDPGEESSATPPAILATDGALNSGGQVEHDFALTWPGIGVGTPQTTEVADWLAAQRDEKSTTLLVESSFFVPGSPVALAVALSEAGLADQEESLKTIRESAIAAGISAPDLRLAGSAVGNSALMRAAGQAVWNLEYPLWELHRRSPLLTSALLAAVLTFVMLRSARLGAIVLAAGVWTTVVSVSLVPMTGGSMTMVLLALPPLMFLTTLSAGIHLANYWRHAVGQDSFSAVLSACRAATLPSFLAAAVLVIGAAVLCGSPLAPALELGNYGAIGALVSLVIVLYGVPALLLIWPGQPPQAAELDHPLWRGLGRLTTCRPALQAAASLLICGAASFGLMNARTQARDVRGFSEGSRIVQDYRDIETNLAGVVPVETIVKFDSEAQSRVNFLDRIEMVRTVQERMRRHPEITGSLSLADFHPAIDVPDDSSMLASTRYHKRAIAAEERVRSGEINGSGAFYTVAPLEADSAEPGGAPLHLAGDELWRITALVHVMSDADYGAIVEDLHAMAQEVLRLQPGADHVITGAVPLIVQTERAVRDSLIFAGLLACGLMLLVTAAQLTSLPAGIVAIIPSLAAITAVLGISSYSGLRVDLGTMITSTLALGMSVGGTLHWLIWFQRGLQAGQSRREAIVGAVTHCGPALWQTSWIVGLSLLVLLPTELHFLSHFGGLMAAMAGASLFGNLVFLPQLLASPLGRFFEPSQAPPGVGTGARPESITLPTPHVPQFDVTAAAVRYAP
ncbi:MAG: hypothetical protein SFV23_23765 [Planctomycetaceae bacterium]|nr:hypothetical protein [Planctomycetaceae bacterium]